jgi:hypothetical protein
VKDGSRYKIEVKPISRLQKNQKKFCIRGYETAVSAQQDLPRLKLHLKSKWASTFVRHIPDDMEELLANPSKRACCRPLRDIGIAPTVEVLSGHVFFRMKRKLNWRYGLLKKQLLAAKSPVISKEAWLIEQEALQIPDTVALYRTDTVRQLYVTSVFVHLRLMRSYALE